MIDHVPLESQLSKPKISVIIPIYGVERYLERCLDSVLSQTFANFEVICVNDGSPDNCDKILAKYAKKDPRVSIITRKNQGLSMARNNGLKLARGKYIYFLDSDDHIHPQLLEITHHFIVKYDADWVNFLEDRTFYKALKKANRRRDSKMLPGPVPQMYANVDKIPFEFTDNPLPLFKEKWLKKHEYKITYCAWAKLYRRELLNGIDFLPGAYFEDFPHTIALCKKHPKTILLNEPLYYYNSNPTSITGQMYSDVSSKHIRDYHRGILFMHDNYEDAPKAEFDFLAKEVVASLLRTQLKAIKRAPKAKQSELYQLFTDELLDLDQKGLVRLKWTWKKFKYWLQFRKLIRQGRGR
ncbi:MAG: glycosyltransferase [Puniceicoccales bacterium]|jgi:glycosyltransferase involved in cell wall biosynthesis|nr:glycosyltransferase [Puniceicoccales bacterium]